MMPPRWRAPGRHSGLALSCALGVPLGALRRDAEGWVRMAWQNRLNGRLRRRNAVRATSSRTHRSVPVERPIASAGALAEAARGEARDDAHDDALMLTLFRSAPVPLAYTRSADRYRISHWNEAWFRAFGYAPDQVDGRTARFARKSMGMRASDLAVALSCDVSLIESTERDDQRPSRMYVLSLAALLRWAAEDPYWRILSGRLVSLPWRNGQVGVIDLTEPSPG